MVAAPLRIRRQGARADLRVDSALDGLRAGAPLTQVAHSTGYADYAHMFREVRAVTGKAPTHFALGQVEGA
ncbi:helix-turn-helix domain-containing protein [Williamsia sp. R60]